MIYAGDQWIQYPVKDLYDTQIMAMSIAAAKDMYDKGQKRLDDFYNKYGDFMSPIAKDMDWYNKNVTGKVNDVINNLYTNGIDPIRSAEGRAAISQLIYSMPTDKIGQLRQSAEIAKKYIDSFGDDTNPELEKFLGRDLSTWSTLGDGTPGSANGIWGASKASKYQDLNKYTDHIFDDIKDSYIYTDKQHYDWYGVTEKDLYNSLTPDKLGGLLNTDVGKFHYYNAIRDLAAQGNTDPTEAEKMEQFRKNIIAANHEKVHSNKKLNELWKMRQENAARRSSGNGYQQQNTNQYSIAELIRRTSSTRIVGKQTQEYNNEVLAKQRDAQIEKGIEISRATNGHSNTYKGRQMFKDAYQDNNYSAAVLTDFIVNQGFQRAADEPNTVIIPKHQFNRLSNLAELQSRTVGFRGKRHDAHLNNVLKNADEVRITFTGGNYGAYMKNATNQNHFAGVVKVRKYSLDANGNKLSYNAGPNKGTYKFDDKVYDDWYFDSHITSQPDDARAGSLGTVNKKGQVEQTKNITITNSQDTKYQDAVMSDRYTTDQYVKGSDYDFNSTYTELTGYPYTQ